MKRRGLLEVYSVCALVFLYLPILVLAVYSFNRSRYSAAWCGFTLDWYSRLWSSRAIQSAALNSLIVAAASSLLATSLAVSAALAQERFSWKRKAWLQASFLLPVVVPELMMAVGFLLLFGLLGAGGGLPALILGHTTLNLPIVWLIVRARLSRLDPRLEEAAMDLGATRGQAFWKVTVPLLMPAVLGGGLMAFAVSLDDFVISFFLNAPNSTTLPVQIYSMIKFSMSPVVNALTTVLFAASVLLVVAAWVLQERRDAHA
ncbi:MAG: ABC transporter permease [Elusimicrobiota bacterium]